MKKNYLLILFFFFITAIIRFLISLIYWNKFSEGVLAHANSIAECSSWILLYWLPSLYIIFNIFTQRLSTVFKSKLKESQYMHLMFFSSNYILLNKQRDIEHCLGKIKVLLLKFIFEFFIFNNTFNDISNILQYDKLFVLFHITWIIYCSVKQKPAQTITPSPPRTLLL